MDTAVEEPLLVLLETLSLQDFLTIVGFTPPLTVALD